MGYIIIYVHIIDTPGNLGYLINRFSDQLTALINNIVLFNNYLSQLIIIQRDIGFLIWYKMVL